MGLKTIIIVPDTHAPYEDKKAWKLLLKVAKDIKPHTLITLGDFGDFYGVSSHSKDPSRVLALDSEVEAINARLDELDALKAKEKYFISGNHEDRLERYLKDKAPELFNVVKVDKLLKLKERKWKYVPYKDHTQVGKLYITHDTGTAGQVAHLRAQADFQSNVVIGHTHRMGYAVVGNAKGRPHVGVMLGWLGDVNQVDYMHKVKAKKDWALGFGVGYMEDNGNVHIQPVPIVDYKCVVQGKLYKV